MASILLPSPNFWRKPLEYRFCLPFHWVWRTQPSYHLIKIPFYISNLSTHLSRHLHRWTVVKKRFKGVHHFFSWLLWHHNFLVCLLPPWQLFHSILCGFFAPSFCQGGNALEIHPGFSSCYLHFLSKGISSHNVSPITARITIWIFFNVVFLTLRTVPVSY